MTDPAGAREAEIEAVQRAIESSAGDTHSTAWTRTLAEAAIAALDAVRSGSAARNHEAGMQAALAAGHANAHRLAVENMIAAYLAAARSPQSEDHE